MANKEENEEKIKEDFLEVDQPIPGQNYVCLSFVSPEKRTSKAPSGGFGGRVNCISSEGETCEFRNNFLPLTLMNEDSDICPAGASVLPENPPEMKIVPSS